ncbi:hypothetical protein ACIQ7Q_24675 [Streptomyces sp. NPDC096176]|uniref:hypothetical protein n=1 Tax=Streptomyces sp. NPDC096176 TaxID=3366079 RepID=UPI00380DDE05
MHRLRCLRLENIGHAAAGFKSLVLDLTGGVSRIDGTVMPAVDVILWLRNGGGKSSLLSLFFSLFLPAKVDFIGHKRGKSLADYVPDQKVSHVIAEWEDTSLPRGGPALITGGVYQWEDGHRPADVAAGWEQLVRRWYAFRPLPGVLDLDSLPVRAEAGQLTQAAFLKRLAEINKAQRGLNLRVAEDQTRWRTLLTDLRLDPAVLRIQRDMNREEGGITELFQFSTCEDFVDFLIELVCDAKEPKEVRASLEEKATKLARRPGREKEQSFLAAAALALKPVKEHSALAAIQQDLLRQQVSVAVRAAEYLSSRAEALGSAATHATTRAGEARADALAAEKRAGEEERRLVVLTRQSAHWAALETDQEAQRCEEKAAAVQTVRQAWELVDTVLELEAQQQQAQALRELLERHDVRQAPLREAMEVSGAALRGRLEGAVEELTGAVDRAKEECGAAGAERSAAEACHRQTAKEVWKEKNRLEQTTQHLKAAEKAVTAARRSGLIGPSEDPGDALSRYEAQHVAAEQRLSVCRDRQTDAQSRLSVLSEQRVACTGQLTAVRERHGAEWDRLGSLQAERRDLAADRRLLELACAEAGTVLDLDRVAADLLDLLAAAGRDCDTRLLQEQADAVEDRRAVDALNDLGFLPAPAEVERAVDRLRELGAPAVSGLQFLREAFAVQEHAAVVAAVPHLIGGVVVCGLVPGGDLAALARRAGVTTAVIAVSSDSQARQAIAAADGSGMVVLPVHPGLLEPGAAERERLRLELRMNGLAGRVKDLTHQRETDATLARRLQAHMDVFGAGPREALEETVARLEQEVDELHGKDRLLKEQASQARQEADALGLEIAALTAKLMELTSQLPQVRELADQHDRVMPAYRTEMEQAREALSVHQAALRRHDKARKEAEARQGTARDRLRQFEDRLQRHASEVRQLAAAVPASSVHALSAAELAATSLETLRGRYKQAQRDWENEIGDDALRARSESCASRIVELTRALDGKDEDVRAKAAELARSAQSGDAEARERARADAAAAESEAIERRGVAKRAKREAGEESIKAWAAVEALDPPYDASRDQAGPFTGADAARKAHAKAQASVELAGKEVHAHQLNAAQQHLAAEKARSAAHTVGRCAHGLRATAERHCAAQETAPSPASPADLDALLFGLLEQLQVSAASVAALSPEQAEAVEEVVVREVSSAAEAHDSARRRLEKSLRKVHTLAQDRTHADVVDGQLLERLLTDLAHPLRLAELIDEIDLREKVVLDELAEFADDQLMVVQACLGLVKTVLDDVQQVARHSRLPQGLGSWSGQQFLSLEIRHVPDDEVIARRLSTEIDRMTEAVAQSTAAKATALPDAMTLTKELVLAALGGRGNVVAKIIKPTQSLDVVQRNSVTQIQKFSGGELLTLSVLLYCTLARLRAAKQGRKASGGVGTLVLDNPFGKANYTPFIGLQRKVAAAHGIQLVYTTGSNDLPALERFPLIIRLRNGVDARTRTQYVQIADRFGDAVSRGLQHMHDDGITSARLHRHVAEGTGMEDGSGPGIPQQSGETGPDSDAENER